MTESSTAPKPERIKRHSKEGNRLYMQKYRAEKKIRELKGEIGDIQKISKVTQLQKACNQLETIVTNVNEVTESVNQAKSDIELFRENRANIFSDLQQRILASISDADIEKASLRDKSWTLAVIYDKERIETGKSTSNVLHGGRIVLIPSGTSPEEWGEKSTKLLAQKAPENSPTNEIA